MKNLFILKVALALTGCLLLSNLVASANESEKPKYPLELSLLKNYLETHSFAEEAKIFKFYDSNDNLVFETVVKPDQCLDKQLVKLLNESDFLTEVRGEKLHRLKN